MSQELDPKIKNKIINVIHALLPGIRIYLYGSRATGKNTSRSDIDLAIDFERKLSFEEIGEVRDVLAALSIAYACDVVDYRRISSDFRSVIDKEKIEWEN